jgi:hypothetical protein
MIAKTVHFFDSPLTLLPSGESPFESISIKSNEVSATQEVSNPPEDFFFRLENLSDLSQKDYLPHAEKLLKELTLRSRSCSDGVFKNRVIRASWQILANIKQELKQKSIPLSYKIMQIELNLKLQASSNLYPAIYTETYITQILKNLNSVLRSLPSNKITTRFTKEFYLVREFLIRLQSSYKYHSRFERDLIYNNFSINFFSEYKNLFRTVKGFTYPHSMEELKSRIIHKILKNKDRTELKTLQIDVLRLAFFPKLPSLSVPELDLFETVIEKMNLSLNPPLSVIEEIIKKTENSWKSVKRLPINLVPLDFLGTIIARINDYFIKNSRAIPENFIKLQIAVSKISKASKSILKKELIKK